MAYKRYNTQVQCLQTFTGSNLYAVNLAAGRLYVVYSYAPHWPLFVYDREYKRWYGNEGKYSPTTSQHRSKTIPLGCTIEWVACRWLIDFIATCQAEAPLPHHLPASLALARSAPIRDNTPHP